VILQRTLFCHGNSSQSSPIWHISHDDEVQTRLKDRQNSCKYGHMSLYHMPRHKNNTS